ncbi:DNA topoisomerase III (plasmid) [Shewanella baltica OS195]|uniref:DNA topoisomerase n=1 Tax=Shewanella baltica (strain OS195) TaxID=399599 RepID=A9L6T8_SHEB9|nr:DNA topoisomerase 3 [Shewanella baltica]ABX51870.1 DNA topoisomerase III [Shewanella baltica OS195]
MRLFIAEKPSVATAIAEVLGITKKSRGFFECNTGDMVTWCFGHMLEQAEPDRYTADDVPMRDGKKIWRVEDLPIIPQEWILQAKPDAKDQLEQIGLLISKATEIVHCGDPDREGQNLVDEVLDLYKNQSPVLRYWASSIDSVAVKRALESLTDNALKKSFGDASIGRQRADWLIGMNLSRAFTLRAERADSRALITVGRVQTPVLSLIVHRDREVENFIPIPFHTLKATLNHPEGSFSAKWKAKEDQAGLDAEGRLISTEIADALILQMKDAVATVTDAKSVAKKQQQPTAFSLSALTILASKKFGYSAQDVLDICQGLYDKKITTYPRSDCGYLPESQFADAKEVLAAIKIVTPELAALVDTADPTIKSKTWDDSKVTAHHGIIPTMEAHNKNQLSEKEKTIYDLIVRSYLAQFYPVHQFLSTTVQIDIDGESFTTSGKVVTHNGWKDVYADPDDDTDESDKDDASQRLPKLTSGESLTLGALERKDAKTKAPSRFNEGSIIAAMIGIHKHSDLSAADKKLLREGDGLGTEATRASILSELKRREYLTIQGKHLISTTMGRAIIDALPSMVKSPVLTALFERMLKSVEIGEMKLEDFIAKQESFIRDQVEKANVGSVKIAGAKSVTPISDIHKCGACNHGLSRRPSSKRGRYWWGCSNYPTCPQMYADFNGKPNFSKPIVPKEKPAES